MAKTTAAMGLRLQLALQLGLGLGMAACGDGDAASSASGDGPACAGAKCDDPLADEFEARNVCVAVRGNGQRIFAHFAALSRIVEHYGLIAGVSGGSSASITAFLLESVELNPALETCGDRTCTASEQAARAAFLLKSIQGYVDVLGATDEALALRQLAPLAGQVQEQGIAGLAESDPEAARAALLDLLGSDDLRELVNPELLELLQTSSDPAFHVRDIAGALSSFGSFSTDDPKILVRPGVIDFQVLARKVGRIANFYAAYGPSDDAAVADLLDACAIPSRGLSWPETAALPAGDSTCGERYAEIVTAYRDALVADEDAFDARVDDEVGAWIPALISTSVITGESVAGWEAARAQYLAGEEPVLDVTFEDVRFGYWGLDSDLARVQSNPRGYDDAKTAKFLSLGEATWAHALSYSPAEPGLTRALELPDGSVSAGGWSDLHPVLALQNLGCDEVVYVTRTGGESTFAQGVATLLGMQPEDQSALYDPATDSAYDRSIREADAVWCTRWDEGSAADIPALAADAFDAPMVTDDPAFTEGEAAYGNVQPDLDLPGCASISGVAK